MWLMLEKELPSRNLHGMSDNSQALKTNLQGIKQPLQAEKATFLYAWSGCQATIPMAPVRKADPMRAVSQAFPLLVAATCLRRISFR